MNITHKSLTASIGRLLRNRNFIFVLAAALALSVGQGATWTEPLLLPALGVAMTLSTISITNHDLASIKSSPRLVLISLLLNYVVMGSVTLLMARWLISDSELWGGFVTIAAMPPAIAVVPFSYMLGGNMVFSLIGVASLYLIALGLTPAMLTLLLGADFFDPLRLLLILVQLIVIPLVTSRVFLFTGLAKSIDKWRETAVSWCFFIVFFTIIGLNHQVFFQQPDLLLKTGIVAFVANIGLGHAVDFIAQRLRVDRQTSISWVLMSTRKNAGLASAIALAFLGQRATIPHAVWGMLAVVSILWWGFYFKKQGR